MSNLPAKASKNIIYLLDAYNAMESGARFYVTINGLRDFTKRSFTEVLVISDKNKAKTYTIAGPRPDALPILTVWFLIYCRLVTGCTGFWSPVATTILVVNHLYPHNCGTPLYHPLLGGRRMVSISVSSKWKSVKHIAFARF